MTWKQWGPLWSSSVPYAYRIVLKKSLRKSIAGVSESRCHQPGRGLTNLSCVPHKAAAGIGRGHRWTHHPAEPSLLREVQRDEQDQPPGHRPWPPTPMLASCSLVLNPEHSQVRATFLSEAPEVMHLADRCTFSLQEKNIWILKLLFLSVKSSSMGLATFYKQPEGWDFFFLSFFLVLGKTVYTNRSAHCTSDKC